MRNKLLFDAIVWTFILFALTTITYSLWPGNLPINRIIGILVIIELIVLYSIRSSSWEYLFASLVCLCFVLSLGFTGDINDSILDGVYWVITSLMLLKFSDNEIRISLYNAINRNLAGIKRASIILNIILAISLMIPNCYSQSWGGSSYFIGFSPSEHTIASGACLVLVLSLLSVRLETFRPLHLFLIFVPIAVVLFSGARVFLIPAGILLLLYFGSVKIPTFIKGLFAPIFLILAVIVFVQSNMWEKFQLTLTSGFGLENLDFLGAFTSGRSVFWLIDINAFIQSTPLAIFFGNGFDYVYEVNSSLYGLRIWAHNDFIDILLSVGLFGFFLYILAIGKSIVQMKRQSGSFFVVFLLAIYLLGPAFLNGFFVSQHLVYSYLLLSVVIHDKSNQIASINPVQIKEGEQ